MPDKSVDITRVIVWETFSEFFLDTSFEENEIQGFAETITASPFSIREIGHILYFEVTPVCISNCFSIAGEWAGFQHEWLYSKCLKQMKKHPFKAKKDLDKVDFFVHALGLTPAAEAYFLIWRIERIRQNLL